MNTLIQKRVHHNPQGIPIQVGTVLVAFTFFVRHLGIGPFFGKAESRPFYLPGYAKISQTLWPGFLITLWSSKLTMLEFPRNSLIRSISCMMSVTKAWK